MSKSIQVLDCTLRDGAYITEAQFGTPVIRGVIKKLQETHIDIIECGWLKDKPHEAGTTFFHIPSDVEQYLLGGMEHTMLTAMIDWDRYDVSVLPERDGRSIDAVRVVFPHGKHKEALKIGEIIRQRGYGVLFQAANTLAYSSEELVQLAKDMNAFMPISLSVVDTFGAMYFDDLERIVTVLDKELDEKIMLGIHAHNNQQLAFALSIRFIELLKDSSREIIVDSTLSGMGRGAGNTTTELIVAYLNREHHGGYDINALMDAIDTYIDGFREKYTWGYSTPYYIAGVYQCHVNNIAYLQRNHRTNAKDMRSIIASLSEEERRHYDYDLLEQKYLDNQGRIIDDTAACSRLREKFDKRKILLIAPGRSSESHKAEIKAFIKENDPVVIGVNAICEGYDYDYLFFSNAIRYGYAQSAHPNHFKRAEKILLSSIKTKGEEGEILLNFNDVIKRGWEHFDNAVILCLRMLMRLNAQEVYISGFDGFKHQYNESYSDINLPTLNPEGKWDELNAEIKDMYSDFYQSSAGKMNIRFLTESIFDMEAEG